MTANFFAKVVDNLFNKVDIEEMLNEFKGIEKYNPCGRKSDEWVNKSIENKDYIRWCMAIGLFETYLLKNFDTFQETELVYKWGKKICNMRNEERNKARMRYF